MYLSSHFPYIYLNSFRLFLYFSIFWSSWRGRGTEKDAEGSSLYQPRQGGIYPAQSHQTLTC